MLYDNLTIVSRKSILAIWQSNYVKKILIDNYPSLKVDIITSETKGDKILDTPLALIGGKGLFTKEIEDILLEGKAHIAVHSLKDMPTQSVDGLTLACVSKREDPRDTFLSNKYMSLDDLPLNSVVGTTSLRRGMQLRMHRKDLIIKSLRGNVQTRLKKLENGEFDAIILAQAGVNRLDLHNSVKYISPISAKILIPSMGQGALGIESINDKKLIEFLKPLNDATTYMQTYIERSFVHTLNGGCQAPIGVYSYFENDKLLVDSVVGIMDGSSFIKESMQIDIDNYKNAGLLLANNMIKKNALEMIEVSKKMLEASQDKM